VTASPGGELQSGRPGSARAARESPRGREPMASSNSRRLSSWTGWRTSCRRRGSTGIGITGCLRRITSSGPPSRRLPSGTSASNARPRPAGMGATVTPRKAAATRITRRKSHARTTRRGLRGRNSWRGWGRSFRLSARTAAVTSGSEETAGRSRLTSNRRFASGRRPGWLRPREVSP